MLKTETVLRSIVRYVSKVKYWLSDPWEAGGVTFEQEKNPEKQSPGRLAGLALELRTLLCIFL